MTADMIAALVTLLICVPLNIRFAPDCTPSWNRAGLIWQCGALLFAIWLGSYWFIPTNLALIWTWVWALRISREREARRARALHELLNTWRWDE